MSVRRPLLAVALLAAVAAAALTVIVYLQPYQPIDAAVERWIQAINVGPLVYVFSFYTAIGGPLAIPAEVVVFGIVLLLNRQAWRLVIGAALTSGWYLLVSRLVMRPRPDVGQVLRVTEHPGAASYPSGHMILFVVYCVVLMVALGYRFLPARMWPVGWVVGAALVAIGGVSRIYSGAHWPSDVLGGLLMAVAWLSLVISIRWISDPIIQSAPPSRRPRPLRPAD